MKIKLNPLSMAESLEYVQNEGEELEIDKFIKKFVKINPEKAKSIKENLEKMDLMKMKAEYLIKIIDLLPEDSESLNKIFNDVSLDEDESKKIFQAIRESK